MLGIYVASESFGEIYGVSGVYGHVMVSRNGGRVYADPIEMIQQLIRAQRSSRMCVDDSTGGGGGGARGRQGEKRGNPYTCACQNQRDVTPHQSQVRPSYAYASVEGRGDAIPGTQRLIESAVADTYRGRRTAQ